MDLLTYSLICEDFNISEEAMELYLYNDYLNEASQEVMDGKYAEYVAKCKQKGKKPMDKNAWMLRRSRIKKGIMAGIAATATAGAAVAYKKGLHKKAYGKVKGKIDGRRQEIYKQEQDHARKLADIQSDAAYNSSSKVINMRAKFEKKRHQEDERNRKAKQREDERSKKAKQREDERTKRQEERTKKSKEKFDQQVDRYENNNLNFFERTKRKLGFGPSKKVQDEVDKRVQASKEKAEKLQKEQAEKNEKLQREEREKKFKDTQKREDERLEFINDKERLKKEAARRGIKPKGKDGEVTDKQAHDLWLAYHNQEAYGNDDDYTKNESLDLLMDLYYN